MTAYFLLLLAVLSRFLPLAGGSFHIGWMNFTAVGGVLLYFGARRSWREMAVPLAVLMATDFCLTTMVYHTQFEVSFYVPTWIWYVAAMALGQLLLKARTSVARVGGAALLGPTTFFAVSNFAVWATSGMYPHTLGGLWACYVAAVPFYRNDVISTALVCAAAFGLPVLVRRMSSEPVAVAAK